MGVKSFINQKVLTSFSNYHNLMSKSQELVEILDRNDSLGIVCHNNPDPDSLASALGLEYIAKENNVSKIDILYSGSISHQQNRAFVNLFDIDLMDFKQEYISNYDLIAFVDHSIPGKNNNVDSGSSIDIVIDHHSTSNIDARFVDHREGIGASATILAEYIKELSMDINEDLATSLLFAIRTETKNFLRGVTVDDYNAGIYLHNNVDTDLLIRLVDPPVSPGTIDSIGKAIENRIVEESCLVSFIGEISERDALPQVADYLINTEGITVNFVFGIIDDSIQVSARSINSNIHMGQLLEEIFTDLGSFGGHSYMAGGKIPLGVFSDLEINEDVYENIEQILISRIFSTCGSTKSLSSRKQRN